MMSFRLVSIAALMAVVSLMLQGCSDSVDDVVAGANTTTMSPEEGQCDDDNGREQHHDHDLCGEQRNHHDIIDHRGR